MKQVLVFIFYLFVISNSVIAQNKTAIGSSLSKVDELYYQNKKLEALEKVNSIIDSSEYKISFENRIKVFQWITLLNFELDFLPEAK